MGILASGLYDQSIYSLSTVNSEIRSTIIASMWSRIKKTSYLLAAKCLRTVSHLHETSHFYKTADNGLKYGVTQSNIYIRREGMKSTKKLSRNLALRAHLRLASSPIQK
jgi:hypothetical protein